MKYKIDIDGYLWRYTGESFQKVFCPFSKEYQIRCGDWCGRFTEPEPTHDGWFLNRCGIEEFLEYDELIDERFGINPTKVNSIRKQIERILDEYKEDGIVKLNKLNYGTCVARLIDLIIKEEDKNDEGREEKG